MPRTERTTEESGGRKQRKLADGRISRGYVSMEIEALEAPVSAEAVGLLARIRQDSQQRERDGEIDELALQAVAVYCRIPKARLPKVLAELVDARLLGLRPGGGAVDLNFPTWGKTREEREEERERWRGRKQKSRQDPGVNPGEVPEMSQRDMPVNPHGVTGKSQALEAEAEAEAEAELASVRIPLASALAFHRALAAIFARSDLCSGVRLAALASPATRAVRWNFR